MRVFLIVAFVAASLAGAVPGTHGAFGQEPARPDAAVEQRVIAGIERLDRALQQGTVNGRFMQRRPGAYLFAPEDRLLAALPVANPQRVAAQAAGPLIAVSGSVDVTLRRITVDGYQLALPGGGAALPPAPFGPLAADRSADAAARAITDRLNQTVQPGTLVRSSDPEVKVRTAQDIRTIAAAHAGALRSGNREAALKIANDWVTLRRMVSDTMQDGSVYKAMYGYLDNYPPWRYGWIARDARAVVAIADGGRAICSGIVIASDLVLTAGHCFPKQPGELQVWFDYTTSADGSVRPRIVRSITAAPVAPPAERWPELMAGGFGTGLLDYAIVRIEAPTNEPALPAGLMPHCLQNASPERARPLYVMGYPRGEPVTVHDSARVHLPFRIPDKDQFDILRLDVAADFADSPDEERVSVLREFDESYQLEDKPDGLTLYRRLRDLQAGGQPSMGIVADTFRGNSGGPVYDHEGRQCVVGILNRGMPDTGRVLTANWKVNERVLPMMAILEDLRRNPATARMVADGLACPADDLRAVPAADSVRSHFASGRLCIVPRP